MPPFDSTSGNRGSTGGDGDGGVPEDDRINTAAEQVDGLLAADVDPVAAGVTLGDLARGTRMSRNEPSSTLGAGGPLAADELGLPPSEPIGGADILRAVARSDTDLTRSDPAVVGGLLRLIHESTLSGGRPTIEAIEIDDVRRVHSRLPPQTPNRHLLLQLLSMHAGDGALTILVDRLVSSPPTAWMESAQVLAPLMRHADWNVGVFFPAALEALQTASLAAPLLDVANFLVRGRRVTRHPAGDRVSALNHLLGELSDRLAAFEENPRTFGDDVETVQNRLGESVALAVSLCDAVGLIGDPSSIAKLNRTAELRHRRVQCEAAGALARLGDPAGRERLLELASDPAARLRAIQYADELGFGDAIDPAARTDEATAEAEMSLWLTQPQQMGVPPTEVEALETRRMLWPSFENPIDVHLVRFEYSFGHSTYSNVGITGPVTFALSADVADLPPEDIFAIYAGWHAEHADIFTVAAAEFNDVQRRVTGEYAGHLSRLGYQHVTTELLGFFLDEQAAVFRAQRDQTECRVVTDGLETIDQPIAGRARPLSAEDVFNLFKGRKMLRTFNPGGTEEAGFIAPRGTEFGNDRETGDDTGLDDDPEDR